MAETLGRVYALSVMHTHFDLDRTIARQASRLMSTLGIVVGLGLSAGCGSTEVPRSAPLFAVPLSLEGEPIGTALVDTGGGYEIMLRRSYGLKIVDSIEVVVFGGKETVQLTEGFAYEVGGVPGRADAAIVGSSICDCNGVGFHFFRKTGVVLGLDFSAPRVMFLSEVAAEGITIDFASLSDGRSAFDTSFIEVEAEFDGFSQTLVALLDTGANATVIRRDLIDFVDGSTPARPRITVTHDQLGSVSVNVQLTNNDDLPDMILGTNVMRKWGDQWYFSFHANGGSVTVVRDDASSSPVSVLPPL